MVPNAPMASHMGGEANALGGLSKTCATRHSEERSDEESLILLALQYGEIPRFARNDNPKTVFQQTVRRSRISPAENFFG